MEKNFELLRPFDLEAAKRGDPLLWSGQYIPVTFVARARNGNTNIIECPGMHGGLLSEVQYAPDHYLYMAPLAWVEGRPVYKGDVLHYMKSGFSMRVTGPNKHHPYGEGIEGEVVDVWQADKDRRPATLGETIWAQASVFTWTEPNPILCEIEGRPVRKGDRLWSTFFNDWFVVGGTIDRGGRSLTAPEINYIASTYVTSCSWNRPPRKVRRQGWVNVYPKSKHHSGSAIALSGMSIYATKEIADQEATEERIACVQIEWTEEVSE